MPGFYYGSHQYSRFTWQTAACDLYQDEAFCPGIHFRKLPNPGLILPSVSPAPLKTMMKTQKSTLGRAPSGQDNRAAYKRVASQSASCERGNPWLRLAGPADPVHTLLSHLHLKTDSKWEWETIPLAHKCGSRRFMILGFDHFNIGFEGDSIELVCSRIR